jgi:hypothetical protein
MMSVESARDPGELVEGGLEILHDLLGEHVGFG